MARVHTHYDNLKVARDAPPEVIRAAYKTLSQKHHPDRNGNSADAMRIIQIINAAYEVLSDPARRRDHDDWIARAEAEESSDREVHHHSHRHSHRHGARRAHRPAFYFYGSRYKSLLDFSRIAHKLRMMLDHFSRKLFGKT